MVSRLRAREVDVHRDDRGSWSIEFVRPSVAATVFDGHLTDSVAVSVSEWFERRFAARGAIHVFHDFSAMTSYDSRARQRLTFWVIPNRRFFASMTILARSPLIAMGANAVNAVLGGWMRATTSRAEYDQSLARCCAQHR